MSLALFNSLFLEHHSFLFEIRVLHGKDGANFHRFISKNQLEFNVAFPITTAEILKGNQATKDWINQKLDDLVHNRSIVLFLIERETKQIVGFFSAFGFDWRVPKCEIAWMLDPDWRGQGLATVLASKGIKYLLEQAQLEKIICRIEKKNTQSMLLAHRLGFKSEALHVKDFRDGNGHLVDVEYMAIWR